METPVTPESFFISPFLIIFILADYLFIVNFVNRNNFKPIP